MDKEQMLKRFAMNIVNQLFDLADVPVEKRQAINDKADSFVLRLLQQTPCSTLRELLVQKMNSVTEERKELSYNSITDIEKAQEIETINWVLSLIDASQPVA